MSASVNKVLLNRDDTGKVVISYANSPTAKLFPWSPSWGEVNYNAYNMATVEFHNELYGWLQEKHSLNTERDVETYLETQGISKPKQWIKEKNGTVQPAYDISLCSYVRNSIHHPENRNNIPFTEKELAKSIEELLGVIS